MKLLFIKPFVGGEQRPGNLHKQSCPCKNLHKLSSPCRQTMIKSNPQNRNELHPPPERRLRVCGKIPTRQCGLLLFSLYPRIRLSQGIDLADLLFPVLRTTELTVLDLLIELHTGVQHLTKDQPFEILEIKPNSEFGIEPHSAIIGQLISLCIL